MRDNIKTFADLTNKRHILLKLPKLPTNLVKLVDVILSFYIAL